MGAGAKVRAKGRGQGQRLGQGQVKVGVRVRVRVKARARAGLACSRRAASYSLIGGHERAPPGGHDVSGSETEHPRQWLPAAWPLPPSAETPKLKPCTAQGGTLAMLRRS